MIDMISQYFTLGCYGLSFMCPEIPARRVRGALVALVVLVATLIGVPAGAQADEIGDKRAQAEALAAKIKQLDHEVEKAAEEANGAQYELDQITQQIADTQTRVTAAEQQQGERQGELKAYAVAAYTRGTTSDVAGASADSDATMFGQREGYLSAAAANRQQLVDQLRASQQDLKVTIGELNGAQAQATAKTKELQERKAQAQGAVDQENKLYAQAQGELQQALADAQRRQAEQEQAAAIARQQAASRQSPRLPPPSGGGAPSLGPAPAPNGGAAAAIAEAERQLGKPYVWAAAGPGSFDCSGLTQWAWRAGGVSLPHYSGAQYSSTTHIPLSEIQPGDLI